MEWAPSLTQKNKNKTHLLGTLWNPLKGCGLILRKCGQKLVTLAKVSMLGRSLEAKNGGHSELNSVFDPVQMGLCKKKMSSLDSKKLSISFFRQSLGGWVGLIVRPIHQPAWKGFEGRVHMQGMLCSGPLVQDGGHQPPKPWHWQNELLSACLPHHPRSN